MVSSNDKKIKVGMIGLGTIGMSHLQSYLFLQEHAEVTAVCDSDPDRLEAGGRILEDGTRNRKHELHMFQNYRKLLDLPDDELNAVVVCVPTFAHRSVAEDVFKRNIDMLLEKPIALTAEDADSMIISHFDADNSNKREQNPTLVQVGLVYRYTNLYRTMASICRYGKKIGRPMMAWCTKFRDMDNKLWYYSKNKSDSLLEKNCHHFDLFNWFIGSSPSRVHAYGGRHVFTDDFFKARCSYLGSDVESLDVHGADINDHAVCSILYESGAVAQLGLCLYLNKNFPGYQVGVLGTKGGHLTARNDSELVMQLGEGEANLETVDVDISHDGLAGGEIGIYQEQLEFVDCIRDRRPIIANWAVARSACNVSLACTRSIEEQREVRLEEYHNEEVEEILSSRLSS